MKQKNINQMKKLNFKKALVMSLVFLGVHYTSQAVTRTAKNNTTVATIREWVDDVNVDEIVLLAKTYNFATPLVIPANKKGMVIQGAGKTSTILKLTADKKQLINAIANELEFSNLTLDAGGKSKAYDASVFFFNKSKGHKFSNVVFRNSKSDGINSPIGWPCEGFTAYKCEFTNIGRVCINIFNRKTSNRNGNVIDAIEKYTVDDCIFNEGYERAVVVDCGNDRQNINGTNEGPRYRSTTNLNGSIVKNCHFYKTNKFHIGGVQVENYNIRNNIFEGLNDNIKTSGDLIHLEQFARDVEIYDNEFKMADDLSRKFVYISIGGTEGHKRIKKNDSNNPAEWVFKVNGGPERRADTKCAKKGNTNGECKRDDHSYGSREIYIAKNSFEDSNSVDKYIKMIEGEDNHIGWRRDSNTVEPNTFGVNSNSKKFLFGGNHKGTCNVRIATGQQISTNNVSIPKVFFGEDSCSKSASKRNKIGNTNLPATQKFIPKDPIANLEIESVDFSNNTKLLSISPNPASNYIKINTSIKAYTIIISNLSGQIVKTINGNNSIKINTNNLKPGIYIVLLKANNGLSKIKKLLID